MDFTPHTSADVARMLEVLGLSDTDGLFAHIPADLLRPLDPGLPPPLAEPEVMAHIAALGREVAADLVCFAGGGVYDHFLPPVVRSLTLRPEFVTSYTPYQSEVAQGVLQALWEYQSMVAALTGLPVSNASLYDRSSAGIEAVNIAVAETGRSTVWVTRGLDPRTREVLATFGRARGITIVEHPMVDGRTVWSEPGGEPPAAVVFAQPTYLGTIEDYATPVTVARRLGALAVASVDPMLLGVLRRPGEVGCDIAFAEGQPLGSPMSFGGPVLGVFATSRDLMRRIPGRLVGRTRDAGGATAYTLTLRTREQDIRREKASSNICTNQSLNAVAAAIHLAWLGPDGLAEVGRQSVAKAHHLAGLLAEIPGVTPAVSAPFAREFAILLDADPAAVVTAMADHGYLAGIPLDGDYPEFPGGLLVAVTERRTRTQLEGYARAMGEVMGRV